MMLSAILWPGLVGFLAGAVCIWAHGSGVRTELSACRWAAEHDALTGLPNRAGIRRRYEAELGAGRPVSMALLDLNGFKQVNDTYGHQAGDRLLVEVARRLDTACRPVGSAGRLGGDEFVLLLPHRTHTEAITLVEAMLTQIAEPVVVGDDAGSPVTLTVSASAGVTTAESECLWATQLQQADIALYHAKKHCGVVVPFQQGMRHPQQHSGGRRRLTEGVAAALSRAI